ncbi:MAG TPA: hypothetical protein VN181_04175 [Thermoanaerobaculia bacterium]|nr:hypothetical protein [Thermoanaerobaculia bacterium]
MIKRTAAALSLLLAVACASTPMSSSSSNATTAAPAGVTTNINNAPEYIMLSAPSQVRTYDFGTLVYGLHVRGTMTNKGFYPAGQIQGKGKFCADGKDYLSLTDLSVHKSGDGTPTAPYVLGCASDNGFQPASREIVTQ